MGFWVQYFMQKCHKFNSFTHCTCCLLSIFLLVLVIFHCHLFIGYDILCSDFIIIIWGIVFLANSHYDHWMPKVTLMYFKIIFFLHITVILKGKNSPPQWTLRKLFCCGDLLHLLYSSIVLPVIPFSRFLFTYTFWRCALHALRL